MPSMKPRDGSLGVVGVLVVCHAPVCSSKATTSVNVPPVSSARRKRLTSDLIRGGRKWPRDDARDPALGPVSGPDADPVAAARHASALEYVEHLLIAQCGNGAAADGVGAQHGAHATRVADHHALAGRRWA